MPFSLINNLQSQASQTSLSKTSQNLSSTIQRLSSGLRINNAGDDAAGLAIANKYRSDIATLSQGVRNANDGVSALQIMDGGLSTISSLLDRATTLATQSASDSFTGNRDTLNAELTKVTTELTRQAKNIGLASTAGADSRFNKALSVFIGGGVDAAGSTNTVGVNLSGAANQVDAAGLGLSSLNIGATAVPTSATTFTAATAIGTSTATAAVGTVVTSAAVSTTATGPNTVTALAQSEQLTFAGADGSIFSVNLDAADDGAAIAVKINAVAAGVNTAGVHATNTAGVLTLDSTAGSYTVTSNRSAGDVNQSGLGGLQVVRTAANTITSDENLTFHVGSTQFDVGLKVGDSVAQMAAKINSNSNNTFGITASVVAGKLSVTLDVTNPNAAAFSITSDKAAAVTNTGLNNTSVTYSPTAITADENLTFTVGASTFGVALKSGDKAADIMSKINSASGNTYGIQASFTAGASPKLVLTADTTNATAGSFSVASDKTGAGSTRLDGATVTVTTASGGVAGATSAIAAIKAAILTLGKVQGVVGAGENNLMQAVDLATSQTTNFQAAESRLRDADISSEASSMSRLNVLQQAGVAALAQANQMSQAVLSLLR